MNSISTIDINTKLKNIQNYNCMPHQDLKTLSYILYIHVYIHTWKLSFNNYHIITNNKMGLKQTFFIKRTRAMSKFNFKIQPVFEWCSCCSIFSFMCSILATIVCLFVLFLLEIVFSVLLSIYGLWLPLWYLQTLLVQM